MFKLPRPDTIWLKSWRDLWSQRGRSLLVILSIAVSTFTLGVILNTYSILSREMNESFMRANPAALTINMAEPFENRLLEAVKKHPEVKMADTRMLVSGQIQNVRGDKFPLLLFVIRDFDDIQMDKLNPGEGSWPPLAGQLLVEQQALTVLKGAIGELVQLSDTKGVKGRLEIVGTTHDVMQAQADWEKVVYAYVSLETYINMGGVAHFEQLKLSLRETNLSHSNVENRALAIGGWLNSEGFQYRNIVVPEPGKHPHANITNGMFMIQKVFASLVCLLSAVLVFNLNSAILHKHKIQIGIMKTLGAQPNDIRKIYYRAVLTLGVVGMLLSVVPSYWVAKYYADILATMMNIDILDYRVPYWVTLIQLISGLIIPLLAASIPIYQAAKKDIRETLLEFGASDLEMKESWIQRQFFALSILPSATRLVLRNVFRRKARFFLSCAVVSIGGAVLISSYNLSKSMHEVVESVRSSKQWDLALRFTNGYASQEIIDSFGGIEGIKSVETFMQSSAVIIDSKKIIPATLSLIELSPYSNSLRLTQLKGEWLNPESNGIVISQLVAEQYPLLTIGNTVTVKYRGGAKDFVLQGVVEVIGVATMFINASDVKQANAVYVKAENPEDSAELKKQMEIVAGQTGIHIFQITTIDAAVDVIDGHFNIIFSLMMLLTLIIFFISGSGIILAISTNITERTRELGVLRAIGASSQHLVGMLVTEGVAMALFSWSVACLLCLPISYLIAHFLGILLFQSPFPLVLDGPIFITSLPIIIVLCIGSAIIPAQMLSRQSVREALIYE